ncbi:MAG TPA: VWA-like domain-containing protein [Methanofastidiosum sp.]|nr:VWA-like domain-containing protein [Methanofastidiosum sp.]
MAIMLSAEDKISRAKIKLWANHPFFSTLVEYLQTKEDTKIETIGVDRYAHCPYNPEFIKTLSDDEMIGVLCHEVMHLAYKHPDRGKGRGIQIGPMNLWNIAIDIVVNYIVLKNGLALPKCGLIPDLEDNGSIDIGGCEITDIENQSAEEIYETLKQHFKDMAKKNSGSNGKGKEQKDQNKGQGQGKGTGKNDGQGLGFDEHDFKEKEGEEKEGLGDKDSENLPKERDWDSIIQIAHNVAKQRGKLPSGMGREFQVYNRNTINWRAILAKEISKMIPKEFTWSRPSKKLLPYDIYYPSTTGEKVLVLISIDTSGSITDKELSAFVSEIVSLARSFDGVDVRVITHDAAVHDDLMVKNGNVQKIKEIKIHGGGGTSHVPLYDHIEKNKYNKQHSLLISMTDGYSAYPDKPCIKSMFILAGYYSVPSIPKWNVGIIEMRD